MRVLEQQLGVVARTRTRQFRWGGHAPDRTQGRQVKQRRA